MKLPPYLLALHLSILFSAVVSGKEWADPAGFLDQEKIERQEIHPGVTWIAASGTFNGQPLRTHIVAADLGRSELALRALAGARFASADSGQFFRRSTTSQLQQDNDALAAINVSFFDIQATQAPSGLMLREGKILREPAGDKASLILLPDGRAALAHLDWKAQVRAGSQRRPLAGVNRPALSGDEIVLYLPPWSRSPGASADFTREEKVLELLVQETGFEPASTSSGRARLTGRVLKIREDSPSVEIGADQFVLTASRSAAPFFRNIKAGAEVEVNWELTGAPSGVRWHELREAVSSSPYLVRGGVQEKGSGAFWESRHPRSAVGISRDGRRLLFIVVDGRSNESAGISLADLADYLVHLGAHEALNFDGGGSSALAARVNGKDRRLNSSPDVTERLVPNGVGVVVVEQRLDRPRVWTGVNGRTMTGLFQEYHASTGNVTLILEGRRRTFPLTSLSDADQALILRADADD